MDPLNYFLIILGGFGVVRSYYKHTQSEREIGEFEYAALSALWGIPVFVPIFYLARWLMPSDKLDAFFIVPMMASPILFIVGYFFGYIGSKIKKKLGQSRWARIYIASDL